MAPNLKGRLTRSLIVRLSGILASGGVAVLPTDTIYGFHCAASRPDAVRRIKSLKGRAGGRGFILLVSDIAMADRVVSRWPASAREILSRVWPSPLTALLPARKDLPKALAPRGAVAVRVPGDPFLRALIAKIGDPLVSTSANVSGGEPMTRIARIEREFPGLEAYVSKRARSPAVPSTIVDFRKVPPVLVRRGRVAWPAEAIRGGGALWRGARSGRQSGNPSKRRSL